MKEVIEKIINNENLSEDEMRKTINIRNKTRLITVINSLIFVIPYIYNTNTLFLWHAICRYKK